MGGFIIEQLNNKLVPSEEEAPPESPSLLPAPDWDALFDLQWFNTPCAHQHLPRRFKNISTSVPHPKLVKSESQRGAASALYVFKAPHMLLLGSQG